MPTANNSKRVAHTPARFTPGPWKVETIAEEFVSRTVTGKNLGGGVEVAIVTTGSYADEVEEANARLISAAPELLEALRTVVDALLYYDGHASNPHDPKGWTESAGHSAYESGQAAIAKAEGREDADQCGYVRGWCEGRRSKVRDPWQWAAWLIFCALCTACAYFVGAGR